MLRRALLVLFALVLVNCITVVAQGPVILQQIPDQPTSTPLNQLINLRTNFSHPDINENLVLTVQQANGSPLPSGVTLTMKAPTLVGSYNTPGFARGITVVGALAYVADGGLKIIDVSTPSAPTFVGSYNTPGFARGITVVGTLAYVADYNRGLQIIDVSTPSAPTLVGSYITPDNAYDITVVGNLAYVADENSGLQIINVSTPSAPTLVGSYNTPGTAHRITVVGTLAYVADGSSGLQIINVSTPSAPTFVGIYNTPNTAFGITVVGTLAYVADGLSGLKIIDVSTPSVPTLVGSYNTPGDAFGITVVGTLAYVADSDLGLQVIDVSQWQLSGTPTVQASYTITVKVEDSQGRFAAYNFTFSDLLVTNPLQDQSTAVNAVFSFVVPANAFTDALDPTLDYSAQSVGGGALPGWLTFTPSTRTFSGTPLSGNQGSYNIEVTATNNASTAASDQFILTVTNRDPVQDNGLANQAVNVSATLNYTFAANTFSDGDGDALHYTAGQSGGGALPSWLSLTSSTRTFFGVPTSGGQGILNVAVTASDEFGGSVTGSFNLTVNNRLPVLQNPINDANAFYNLPFGLTIAINTFVDPDGDSLTYDAVLFDLGVLPNWLTFSSSTRLLSGTPSLVDEGQYTLQVSGDDGYGGFVSTAFILSVGAVGSGNSPPVVTVEIPDQTATNAEPWGLTVPPNTFDDPDSDPLTYSAALEGGAILPNWLAFDTQTKAFAGTPAIVGFIRISVRAEDGRGGFVLDTFTLTIRDNTNFPPQLLNQLPNQNVNVGSSFQYTVSDDTFFDANGNVLVYSAMQSNDKPLPNWLSFDGTTRTFSGKPSNTDTNTYADRKHTIKVCASDGTVSACSSFLLSVAGASAVQEVITALIIVGSIASTIFGIYSKQALLWNTLLKKKYEQDAEEASLHETFTHTFSVPSEKIELIKVFNKPPAVLAQNKLLVCLRRLCGSSYQNLPDKHDLPDWLHFDRKTMTLSGVPTEFSDLYICAVGFDGRYLEAFKLRCGTPREGDTEMMAI